MLQLINMLKYFMIKLLQLYIMKSLMLLKDYLKL